MSSLKNTQYDNNWELLCGVNTISNWVLCDNDMKFWL